MTTVFCIVGFGSIGRRHAAVLEEESDAFLGGIADVNDEALEKAKENFPSVPCFSDIGTMLACVKCDILIIATPHDSHASLTVEACNLGVNVLVEKPMAITADECDRMNEAAKKNGVNLWVVKQNRFNIPVQLTKDALENKRLGEIFMVKCDILWNRFPGYYNESPWRGSASKEGGALYTLGSHFIDLLLWWFGDIEAASGFSDLKTHDIDFEDIGMASLKFQSGALGQLNWTTCVYNKNYEGSITIIGEKGTIKIGGKYLNKIEYWDVEGYPLSEGVEYVDKPNLYGKYQGTSSNHDQVIRALCQKITLDQAEIVDGIEARRTIVATERIYSGIKSVR